jgi:tRNA pseudouridine13 synthase
LSQTDIAIPDWTRAHGAPVCRARIRTTPDDFYVEEYIGIEPDNTGEHDLLQIVKTGANTAWVARQLARHASVANVDVGFAGLKDRNAVTRQSFSVRRPSGAGTDWSTFAAQGVEIVQIARHSRKLRRGAHQHNKFEIRLRGPEIRANRDALTSRIAIIASDGVPNYFGEQRFGRNGSNIELAKSVLAGKRVKREHRSIAISTARSLIFNAILAKRVQDGTWNKILDGELANLNGSGSVFASEGLSVELERRCREQDIHPTASMWGDGAPRSTRQVAGLEHDVAADYAELADGLTKARVDAGHRPLRLLATNMHHEFEEETLSLGFSLSKGAFATALLRELCQTGLE